MRRRRAIALAALALCVPLPAFALTGDSDGPAELDVSASLAGCGVAESQVVCEIAVSFEPLEGADSYTASVTSPDGSLTEAGAIGAGGGSLVVPYSGSGTYVVRVNAYGEPPEADAGKGELIATDTTAELERGGKPRDGAREPGLEESAAVSVETDETREPGAGEEAVATECAPIEEAEEAEAEAPEAGTEEAADPAAEPPAAAEAASAAPQAREAALAEPEAASAEAAAVEARDAEAVEPAAAPCPAP